MPEHAARIGETGETYSMGDASMDAQIERDSARGEN